MSPSRGEQCFYCQIVQALAQGSDLPEGWLDTDIQQPGDKMPMSRTFCGTRCLAKWAVEETECLPHWRDAALSAIDADPVACAPGCACGADRS